MRARVAAVAAVALGLLASGPPAHAAEKAIWGPLTIPGAKSAFPLYERLGVDTLQLQMTWSRVAPTRPANASDPADPAYRWPAEIASAVEQASRHGMKLAVLVTGAPAWSNGNRPPIFAPASADDFAQFMAAASRRYPSIRRWMIWGEPNMAVRFRSDGPAPQRYAELLDAAYVALKRVSAGNVVIGGMTWTGGDVKPADFVAQMRLPDGRAPRLDWFGHNPYPFRFPRLSTDPIEGGWRDASDLDTFHAEVNAALRTSGGREIPFWLSEFMIQSERASPSFATFVSRDDQARWLTAGFDVADSMGSDVRGIGWFQLVDQSGQDGSRWGLYTTAWQRKPAYTAFLRAPSHRLRPTVGVARSISRSSLSRRGLRVSVRARAGGLVRVQLRRGGDVVRSARVRTRARRAVAQLRASGVSAGTYTLVVRAPRAARVTRSVRVR